MRLNDVASRLGRGIAAGDWRRALVLYALPLNFFAAVARSGTVMVDGDTYLHIVAGRWIVEHRQFIHTDFFSYTFAGTTWNDPEWLSEVLMAVAYTLADWSGVALLFAIAFGLTSFLLVRYLLKHLDPLPSAVVLGFTLYCIADGQSSRPYALALPILVAWTAELLSARSESRAPHLWLLPLMTLWSNLHGSFVFGLSLLGFFAFEAFVASAGNRRAQLRMWLPFVLGAAVAAAINPNGFDGLIAPIRFVFRPVLSYMADWASTSVAQVAPFEIALLAFIALCVMRPVRIPITRVLLLVALLHMALLHRRHITIFAVVAPMVLAEPISRALVRASTPDRVQSPTFARLAAVLSLAAAIGISAVRVAAPNPQVNRFSPATALFRVPARIIAEPVFNEDVLGGFLIWHGVKPFIDSRQEMVSDAFFENYVRMCNPDRDAIIRSFARYNIKWTFLLPDNPANAVLDSLPQWRVLYSDQSAVVHVRADLMRGPHT